PRRGQDVEGSITITLEEAHRGATRSVALQTSTPDARGAVSRSTRTYDVRIPAGTTDGSVIRLSGQGAPGAAGGEDGDVRLRVHVAPHPTFRLHGHDLETTVNIAPWEAALGARVDAQTLDGPVTLTIPKGSQSGQKLRLRGQGMRIRAADARGDLYVELRIVIPPSPTPDELNLFEQLKDTSTFNPRNL
ncbi:MAG: DnaJ C-terminal domain-containing protein, partial [Planctomycetota bacterium]|nr:DnaJ C-terminal domain-containing protein [Planctomycetota bacterium]